MPESSQGSEQNNEKCDAATDFPEIILGLGGVDDAGKVHTVIGSEKGERKKNDRYDGEYEDSFVLAVRNYREFILFNRAQLKELGIRVSADEVICIG